MAKHKPRNIEPVTPAPTEAKTSGGAAVVTALTGFAGLVLALSVLAMLLPNARLWAVHQFAFLDLPVAVLLLAIAGVLLLPFGAKYATRWFGKLEESPAALLAGAAFVAFLILSVYGNLLGDGQLSLTRLAHVGDMMEAGVRVPPGRFFSQKEPGTMLLHEAAFRVIKTVRDPKIEVASGLAGKQARVERQLVYRGFAEWSYRILSSLAGAVLIFFLVRWTRARSDLDAGLFWAVLLGAGGWLAFFGYVENYAWVTIFSVLFLLAGLRAAEPPRKLPILPIVLFGAACAMHYVAITLLPALIFLLWTLHFEPKDRERADSAAPLKRAKIVIALFLVGGLAGYIYVKGWKGWISVIPLLPRWVDDGYALLSLSHFVDLLNLLLWCGGAALLVLLFTPRAGDSLKDNTQERFLLIAAGASALFAVVFSPNLGMARDWDIVTTALWPLLFWGAWRLSKLEFSEEQRSRLRASLLALTVLILVPAILVQAREQSAIARFKSLLDLDRSRSAYGWENLALHYQRTGELDLRVQAWEQAVAVEQNPRYVFNLAEAYRLNGQYDAADTTAIRAATLNNDFAQNLLFYAVAQAKNGKYDRTLALIDTALSLNPEIASGQAMKQWATRVVFVDSIAASGDTTLALQWVEDYQKMDSTNSFWPEYRMRLRR